MLPVGYLEFVYPMKLSFGMKSRLPTLSGRQILRTMKNNTIVEAG